MHEHARPLNKRRAWRLITGSAFIKMVRLKAIIAISLLVGLGECARDLTKCVVCKKKKKNCNMVLTKTGFNIHELLSNFISPLDLYNSARICSACRIALTSPKSKQSAETFVDASKHFQFFCFEIWERNRNITKKTIANFSEWVRSAQKPVFSSAVN